MDNEEIARKLTEHDIILKEVPELTKAVNKQNIMNERILNKMESLSNSLDRVNTHLDNLDKRIDTQDSQNKINWVESVKKSLCKVFEYGCLVGIVLLGAKLGGLL